MTDVQPAEPALSGIMEPVPDELFVEDLQVIGQIPEALRGAYLRNGPNPEFAPLGAYHPFDGDGMIHALYLEGGKASYKNRWVETPALMHERKAGKALFGGALNMQFPPEEVFEECGMLKNVANTNVYMHADKILGLWEGGLPSELTWDLDTVGLYDFDGELPRNMSAHPTWDAKTGEMMFLGYTGLEKPFAYYHVVDKNGRLTHWCDLDVPRGTFMHDLVSTERFTVIFDMPAVIEPESMMRGDNMWQPELGCRIGVIPRYGKTEDVRWFDVDPFYVFHFMNAWEDSEHVIEVIGTRLPSLELDPTKIDPALNDPEKMGMCRWRIDLQSGQVTEEMMATGFQEFSRVNDEYNGYKTRFGHASYSRDAVPGAFDSIIRWDLEKGEQYEYKLPEGHVTGEAVFAADPDGTDERDGWIMAYDIDSVSQETDIVILSGHDIHDEVARVKLPRRVPNGFHGNWMPGVTPTR